MNCSRRSETAQHDGSQTSEAADTITACGRGSSSCSAGMLGATAVGHRRHRPVAAHHSSSSALTIVAASFVALGAYRALVPLVSARRRSKRRPWSAGARAPRSSARKTLVLRSIKELEFDFAMGKVAQADFDEMGGRLRRGRWADAAARCDGTGYREQIERELASAVGAIAPAPSTPHAGTPVTAPGTLHAATRRSSGLRRLRQANDPTRASANTAAPSSRPDARGSWWL